MTETKKPTVSVADKPAAPKQPSGELNEQQLEKVSGGKISQACVTGKHIAKGTIIT